MNKRRDLFLAALAVAVVLAIVALLASGGRADAEDSLSTAPPRESATARSTDGPPPGATNAGPIALMAGTLSYVDPKYGPDYLALPFPRGTVATICAVECITRRSTDFGPDQRVHPNRIADLSAADFVVVCGVPLSAGLCQGTVELEPPVDPADDEMRVEDGGPTLPPTSTED